MVNLDILQMFVLEWHYPKISLNLQMQDFKVNYKYNEYIDMTRRVKGEPN